MKIGETIYLDHQASTPLDVRVRDYMNPYFEEEFGNPHSADHIFGWKAALGIGEAAASVAELIGADPDEIVFTSGATEANNLALLGLARRACQLDRSRILISAIEHKCVLAIARILQEQFGYLIDYIPVDSDGHVDLEALNQRLDEDVLLVSVMTVNNEIGTIQDIPNIAKYVHAVGAILHTDAAQAPGALDLADAAKHSDLISLSGHKMYGPKGIGASYIRRDLINQIEPLIYGGGQQLNLRSGTLPTPLCAGMGYAAKLLMLPSYQEEVDRLRGRRDKFIQELQNSIGSLIKLNGPVEQRHPGNANFCFMGFDAHEILGALQPYLAASTGSACTSGISETSHVLRSIGLSDEDSNASIRFSLGRNTTEDDVDEAVMLIGDVVKRLTNSKVIAFG